MVSSSARWRLGLFLAVLQGLGEGLAIVDVDGDAEPVEDVSGLVADGLGTDPPPAGAAVAGADHAGFDVVVVAGGDSALPGFENALAVVGWKASRRSSPRGLSVVKPR